MNPTSHSSPAGRRALLLVVTAFLVAALGWILSGERVQADEPAAAATDVVAEVQGTPITQSELEASAEESLRQLDMQRRQMEMQLARQRQQVLLEQMESLLQERLLAAEAAARDTTTEALEETIGAEVGEVSEAEIDEFYTQLQQQRGANVPPKEQLAEQIRVFLKQQKEAEAREAFFDGLEAKYEVVRYLEEPRIEVATDGFPAKGPENAPVTIVEFSDFECPYCSRVVPALEQVTENYGDKVRLVFRQFPLNSIHPNAQKAAEASLCADEQGQFWAMHDRMFAEQKQLAVPQLQAKAEAIGLDGEQFAQCLESGKYADEVNADLEAGQMVGVTGTPALIINGRLFSGALPYEQLSDIIDEELARAERRAGRSSAQGS